MRLAAAFLCALLWLTGPFGAWAQGMAVRNAQLFYRGEDGRWVEQQAGTEVSVADWPLPGRYRTFDLARVPGKPVRYWLRIQQEHIDFAAPMRLYRASMLLPAREQGQFLFGAYFGLVGLIALCSLANAAAHAAASLGWLIDGVNAMPADACKLIRPMNF